jgi:hypothetical protein
MLDKVHVFIATTEGLVPIVQVKPRVGQTAVSLATIGGTSKVASIISGYRDFVSKVSSPLPGYFPERAYHLVLGKNIDQGESWQLGVAIAHLLQQQSRLGNGEVAYADQVIIATGEIDFVSTEIKMISHLAQKCMSARRTVTEMQQMNCRVEFIVPSDNYRQPLPDIQWPLSPVDSMADLEQLLINKGVIPATNEITQAAGPSDRQIAIGQNMSRAINSFNQGLGATYTLARSLMGKHARQVSFGMGMALLLAFMYWVFPLQPDTITLTYTHKSLGQCALAEPTQIAFDATAIAVLPELELSQLCSIDITLPNDVNTVWLVADSYALIPLTPNPENALTWQVPIPSWQQADRNYTLMTFTESLDESDLQSLSAYLLSLHEENQLVSLESLSLWASKQEISSQFIQQTLLFEDTF